MLKRHRFTVIICLLLLFILFAFTLSLSWGSYRIPFYKIPSILFGRGTKLEYITIYLLRLPRIVLAIIVGIALSVAGGLLQTITRNDLADSGMIGINAGASLAAVLFITSQSTLYYKELSGLMIFALPVVAMGGSLAVVVLIYFLSFKKGVTPQRLLLIGIGLNVAITAFITFYSLRVSRGQYNQVLVWTSGSLWGSNWKYVWVTAPIILLFTGLTLFQSKTLDVLNLGDELAIGLGVNLQRSRKWLLFFAVVLAGVATSVAGNISFLGLITPHMAKKLVGTSHKRFIPVGALLSVIIILIADSLSRNLFSPIEIPVGITISLIGVPYFIYLMVKEQSA